MTNLKLLMARVLEHLDQDRWERQSALLMLIADRERAVALPLRDIQDLLERTPAQARWDQTILERMAVDRILIRWPGQGRRPDLWVVNDRVEQWRHVPWITPRRQVVKLLLGQKYDVPGHLYVISAGQSVALHVAHPQNGGPADYKSPGGPPAEPHATAQQPHATAQRPGETQPGATRYCPSSDDPSPSVLSIKPSLPSEGESEAAPNSTEGTDRLRRALNEAPTIHVIAGSKPARRLAYLEAEQPGRTDEYVEEIRRMVAAGTRSFSRIIDELEALARSTPEAAPAAIYRPFDPVDDLEPIADPGMAAAALRAAREALGRATAGIE